MKTIDLSPQMISITDVLAQARREDLVVRDKDGSEFVVMAIDDFDKEIIETRKDKALMAFLEERARQTETIPLAEVRKQLGL